MFRNILITVFALSMPFKGMSSDIHHNLSDTAYSVLAPKANALTLDEINDMVVNDQVDIQISYENLLQAQKRIGLARAQYFPYGLGTVTALYFLNSFSPLLLIELVTSLPSKVYNVQSEKNIRMATQYSNEALAHNIKNQVANLYYTILKEESALKLTEMQLTLLENLYKATEDKVLVGLTDDRDLKTLELRILDIRDIIYKFSGYLAEEKAAFNTLISKDPEVAKHIQLQTVSTYLDSSDYGLSDETLRMQTIDRSPELVAADYMITAALRGKSSTKWSVLSFSGIGFGYWSRVKVAGSKVEQARINRMLVETNLSNQVYVLNSDFHRTLDHFESERAVFNDTALFYESEYVRFRSHDIPLDRLLEAGIIYLKDFSEYAIAHYDSLIKLSDLERAILGSAKGNITELDLISVNVVELNNGRFSLSIDTQEDVDSVEYVFDAKGWDIIKVKNPSTGHRVSYKRSMFDVFTGHVNVKLKNNKIITKKFEF